jgi:putative nucleotidyltransferase with HDIG domain
VEELTAAANITLLGEIAIVSEVPAPPLARRVEHPGLLAYAIGLNAFALVVLMGLAAAAVEFPPLWVIAVLAVAAALAERQSVTVARGIESSVSFLPLVFSAVVFGPLAAGLVAGLANLVDLYDCRRYPNPYLRVAVYTPIRALTGVAAGLAAGAVGATPDSTFALIFVASLAAATANHFADSAFNVLTLIARGTGSLASYARNVGPYMIVSLPLYVPVVAVLVVGYETYSMWAVTVLLAIGLALHRLLHLYQEQREAARGLAEANRRLEKANMSFASALVATLDARDRYTAGHSAAVADYARDIAARMGLSQREQDVAHLAGLVHDIGKVGLPVGLLEKSGPLSLAERRQMEQHVVIGEGILARVEDYSEIAAIVRHHHERVDGNGYPDGLRGDEIPLLARIIAVADAYDAMTSDRPYREAMPSRVARLRLAQAVEAQFDTSVVAALEALLAGRDRFGSRESDLPVPAPASTPQFAVL